MEAVGEGLSLTIMWALAGEHIHIMNHFSTTCSGIMRTKERDLVAEEDNITERDLLGLQLSLLSTKCVFFLLNINPNKTFMFLSNLINLCPCYFLLGT